MAVFTVTSTADSGAGSLRAAITAANAAPGASTINFTVAGNIILNSDLPAISNTVTLDATTAPGHAANGAPVVGLDCNTHAGLVFAAGSANSQLLGLAVGHATGNGVTLNAGTITLAGDYIGLTTAGTALGNTGDGVFVAATSGANLIGLNPTAASGIVSNVISGNGGNGISFHNSAGNTLVDNEIGTNPAGTAAIANGGNGIWFTAASTGNEIGGTAYINTTTGAVNDPTGNKGTVTPVFVVPPLGNLVSGNAGDGILIDGSSVNNILNGNFVGTAAGGDAGLGNGQDGVAIVNSNGNSLLGCTVVDNPFIYYNVIDSNGGNGLHVTNSNNITVQANFFGIGADNTTLLGNANDGILVDGSSQTVTVGGVIPLGNVSAGNGNNGIEVTGTSGFFTTFNTFGGLLAFKGAAPNGNDGLLITATGGNQTVQTNVFSGNTHNGIEIGGDASGVTVDPNIAGLTTNGRVALPNGNDGLLIDGTAHNNIVGGYQNSVIPQNLFSGNLGYGVAILGSAHDNKVFNTYIGTDVFGTGALGNAQGGVLIGGLATNNTIGGIGGTQQQPVADVISGNGGNGVTLQSTSTSSVVLNNVIGFGVNGVQPLPNAGVPVATNGSTGNIIGGNVACFAAGSRIATPSGDIAVEDLRAGDVVLSQFGGSVAVRWIGHRRIDCARHPEPAKVNPVRVRRGAFGEGMPACDLLLSPDHAVYLDGALVPARCLVDGVLVVQEARRDITYYHVELPQHDVVVANGLACESYLDTGNRGAFANAGGVVQTHPDFARRVWEAEACAPQITHGPRLGAIRARLARRSAAYLGAATGLRAAG